MQKFFFALRLAIGIAIIALLLRSLDIESFKSKFFNLDLWPVLGAGALFLLAVAVSTGSWLIILRALALWLNPLKAFQLNLINFFFNNIIPSGVGGDIWRSFAFSGLGVPYAVSLLSVVMERWMAFGALAVMSLISLFTATDLLAAMKMRSAFTVLTALLLGGFALSLIVLPRTAGILERFFTRFKVAFPREEFKAVLRRKDLLTLSAAVSLTSPILEGVAFWCLALSVGVNAPLLSLFAFIPIFRLVHHLPLTVNAIGTQDALAVYFFKFLGTSMEQALLISFLFHALKILVSCLGAPLFVLASYRGSAPGRQAQ